MRSRCSDTIRRLYLKHSFNNNCILKHSFNNVSRATQESSFIPSGTSTRRTIKIWPPAYHSEGLYVHNMRSILVNTDISLETLNPRPTLMKNPFFYGATVCKNPGASSPVLVIFSQVCSG